MANASTRSHLARAWEERKSLEAGGESVFRSLAEADAEIARLHAEWRAEEHEARLARREALRRELIEADIAREACRLASRQADERYAKLRNEASALEVSLAMDAEPA